LAEGEAAHRTSYQGCRHAKEEMHKRKAQGALNNTKGRLFSSKFVKSNLSFTTAVRGQTDPMTEPQVQGFLNVQYLNNRNQVSQFQLQL
jgi:hypothetical protein